MSIHAWAAGLAMTIMITMGAGCNSWDGFERPGVPRFRGEPANGLILVTYKKSGDRYDATIQDTSYRLFSLPGNHGAFLRLDAFQAEYFDMDNKALSGLDQTKRPLAAALFVPAATPTLATSVQTELPLATSALQVYGENAVRTKEPNNEIAETISAMVTLFGADDRGAAIELRFNVPIIFRLESADNL